jgi:hypothetical protein
LGVADAGLTNGGLSSVTVRFNEALNADSAENPSLYSVHEAVRKKGKTAYTKLVPIENVTYEDQEHTVTITLAQPVQGRVQVTVHGGVSSTDGGMSRVNFKAVAK